MEEGKKTSADRLPLAFKSNGPLKSAATAFLNALDSALLGPTGSSSQLLCNVGSIPSTLNEWRALKGLLQGPNLPRNMKDFLLLFRPCYIVSGKPPQEKVSLTPKYENILRTKQATFQPTLAPAANLSQPNMASNPPPTSSQSSSSLPSNPPYPSPNSYPQNAPQIPPKPSRPGHHPTLLIDAASACLQATNLLQGSDPIGVDCEFVQPSNALALVQVCSASGQVFIFDLLSPERVYLLGFLYDLLANPRTKVMHDCRQDCANLAQALGVTLSGIFDTQVAEALLCSITEQKSLLSDVDAIERGQRKGLNQLLSKFNLPNNPHKENVKHELWGVRPLPQLMINYAAEDVTQLIPLYNALKDALASATIALGEDLSAVQSQWFVEDKADNCDSYANKVKLRHDKEYFVTFVEEQGRKKRARYLEEADESVVTIPVPPKVDEEQALESLLYSTMPNKGKEVRSFIEERLALKSPVEIVVDHRRPPSIRFSDGSEEHFAESQDDIYPFVKSLQTMHQKKGGELPSTERGGRVFSSDNRTGIAGTLHRISCIRNRAQEIIGLTYRIGRHVPGAARMIDDLIEGILPVWLEGGSFRGGLLLVGPPGKGKTTLLREITNVLSTRYRQQVVIVDTSDEIAGPSDVPDPCVGNARRMSVPNRNEQEKIMIEAVQNQTPTVIVVDEIGNPKEVHAVRTISQRGVSVVGTAHGTTIHTILSNPDLIDLVGGVEAQTLGDTEAKMHAKAQGKKGTDKTRFKRKHEPPFSTLIEIIDRNRFRIYRSLRAAVDSLLENNVKQPYYAEERWLDEQRRLHSKFVRVKKPSELDVELDYVIV